MYHNNVTFELLTENDNSVTEYHKNSQTYVEGRKGSEYKIRIKNNNYFKVLVIPSVDGLSVMDGKPADYKSSGYILYPYETTVIEGWRTDLDFIRKFIFTRKNKSYSAKTEQGTSNLGVIGLAVFREKLSQTYTFNSVVSYTPDMYSCFNVSGNIGNTLDNLSQNDSYSSSERSLSAGDFDKPFIGMVATAAATPTVGTGMGNKKESKVVTESFDRKDRPYITMQIFYYERKQLEKMGIVQTYRVNEPQRPNPFPVEQHPMQFCREV